MKKSLLIQSVGVLAIIMTVIFFAGQVLAATTLNGPLTSYQCVSSESRWKTDTESMATLPSGYTITSVYVKAGSSCIEVYPADSEGCYTAIVSGNTVTVTGEESSECQDISHLEGTYSVTSTPTPTPTGTLTPTPTGTLTPTPTDTPTPTPTGTLTPTLTPTPTPTPNIGGDGDGLSDGKSDGRSDGLSSGVGGTAAVLGVKTAAKRGEVLGASTMAATGSFPTTLASIEQVFGAALVALGAGLHGKKKFFNKSK